MEKIRIGTESCNTNLNLIGSAAPPTSAKHYYYHHTYLSPETAEVLHCGSGEQSEAARTQHLDSCKYRWAGLDVKCRCNYLY